MPFRCHHCKIAFTCVCESGIRSCGHPESVFPRLIERSDFSTVHICSNDCLEDYFCQDSSDADLSYSSSSGLSSSGFSSSEDSMSSDASSRSSPDIQESVDLLAARGFAMRRRGHLLSVIPENKLRWKCRLGHRWRASLCEMREGHTWCPKCKYKSERHCRYILEDLFNREFMSQSFKNCHGKTQYFDGFCESLSLAYEYHGRQHYEYVSYFHRKGKDLEKQKIRDALKRDYCTEQNIRLLEIPYSVDRYSYIRDKLVELGYPISPVLTLTRSGIGKNEEILALES
jgi:hypothetical protein